MAHVGEIDAHLRQYAFGAIVAWQAGAEERKHQRNAFGDTWINLGKLSQGRDVARLADKRKAQRLVQRRINEGQRRRGGIARARALKHLLAVVRPAHPVACRLRRISLDMQNTVDVSGFQSVDQQGGKRAS